jgi:hypothetical protein
MNTKSNVTVNMCAKGFGAVEIEVMGENLGQLISYLVKAFALMDIQRIT